MSELLSAVPVLSADHCVRLELDAGAHFRTHLHHTAELFVCTAGTITMTIFGAEIPVAPGQFFLVFPDIPHCGQVSGSGRCTILQIHFHVLDFRPETAGSADRAFAAEAALGRQTHLTGPASPQLCACLEGIVAELTDRPSAMAQLYLAQLGILLSRMVADGRTRALCRSPYLPEAARYISLHYSQKLSVREVADAVGISERYLTRLFREHLDIGVAAYISHVRISKAIDFMYAHPHYPLTRLALDVGFSSQQHFSKVFRETMSVPPRRYFAMRMGNM